MDTDRRRRRDSRSTAVSVPAGGVQPRAGSLGANRDEGWTFVNRSFPSGLTPEQYEAAVDTEFGFDAAAVLAQYPATDFVSSKDALARLVGDAEYVCEATRLAYLLERTKTPVFLFSFEYEVDPVVLDRVVHGLEVNFVFGNNYGPPLFAPYTLGGADLALSHTMSGYWTRFAATGDPNTDDPNVVHWPGIQAPDRGRARVGQYLRLDATVSEGSRLREAQCNFWQPFSFRSITGAVPASAP